MLTVACCPIKMLGLFELGRWLACKSQQVAGYVFMKMVIPMKAQICLMFHMCCLNQDKYQMDDLDMCTQTRSPWLSPPWLCQILTVTHPPIKTLCLFKLGREGTKTDVWSTLAGSNALLLTKWYVLEPSSDPGFLLISQIWASNCNDTVQWGWLHIPILAYDECQTPYVYLKQMCDPLLVGLKPHWLCKGMVCSPAVTQDFC